MAVEMEVVVRDALWKIGQTLAFIGLGFWINVQFIADGKPPNSETANMSFVIAAMILFFGMTLWMHFCRFCDWLRSRHSGLKPDGRKERRDLPAPHSIWGRFEEVLEERKRASGSQDIRKL